MKNKLRLIYYNLLIQYYKLYQKNKTREISYGWYYTEYDIKVNSKRDKIIHYTTLYNDVYNATYPEKIKVECLDTCGLSPFEKHVSNLTDNYTIDESEPLMIKIFSK